AQPGTNVAQMAPPTAPIQTPSRGLSANDAAWHFGMTPDEARRLTRRQLRVLNEAVTYDEAKKARGEQIEPPSLGYQNIRRQQAGLPPINLNMASQKLHIGNAEIDVPINERAVAPYYRPETGTIKP